MIYELTDIGDSSVYGRHFMASIIWNTEPEKMVHILQVMGDAHEKYGLPIDYESLGIIRC